MNDFCCQMRRKYLVGIVAENPEIPQPTEAVDFIDFEAEHPEGKIVMRIKFCPFCGKEPGQLRII